MTEKLPKTRIEHWRAFLSDVEPGDAPELNALCDLALEALAMRPRPISELPKESCPVLIWPIKNKRWVEANYFDPYYFAGGWRHSEISHFIPQSSLPKVTP